MVTRHVLVMHDDADYRRIYRAALEYAGLGVIEADCAADALAAFDAGPISLVICDLYARDVADESFVARLRRDPRAANVPVLVVTAWTTAPHRIIAERARVDSFLSLPVTPKVLIEQVGKMLGDYRGMPDGGAIPSAAQPRVL